MICSDIWLKYHEWYFKIVLHNFTSRYTSEIWDNFEISRVVFMPNITCNSCYYLFLLHFGKFSHLTPCVYIRRVVSQRRRANFLFSAQLVQTLSQVEVLFTVFWFPEFSFSIWISWFQNLEIFPPFLRNSCDKIIWWFQVTIVTVIFTCRYFKLSSSLSQSNGRNFSGSNPKF